VERRTASTDGYVIRPATPEDLAPIKALALEAWLHTYRDIFSEQQIRAENEQFYNERFHGMLLERTKAGRHLFDVAEEHGRIVGLIDFDFNERENWLTRLYIRPALIGTGLGTLLLEHSDEQLRAAHRNGYFLLVHERNALGIRFYERRGFQRFSEYDRPADHEICYQRT
jgi:GNAT superfamily N-acetyltransferase